MVDFFYVGLIEFVKGRENSFFFFFFVCCKIIVFLGLDG